MKTLSMCIVATLLISAGAVLYRLEDAKPAMEGKYIPYTIIRREITYNPDGSKKVRKDLLEAIRSDGSRVIKLMPLDNPDEIGERQVFFSDGVQVTINDQLNLKSTVVFRDIRPMDIQRNPLSNCLKLLNENPKLTNLGNEEFLGIEQLGGYRVVKIANRSGITRWLALDYGCACLKDRMDFGEANGYGENNLLKLIPGEPEVALFEISSLIKEAPPSERMKQQLNKNCDTACSARLVRRLQKMDEEYYKHQAVN